MSWNVSLYIGGTSSLDQLAQEISDLLKIPLRPAEFDGTKGYQYSGADFIVELYADHGMENDRDMNFEDYCYDLSFWRQNLPDRDQAQMNTLKFARTAFERLKEKQYPLMLVENSQRKLESFDPH